MVAGSVSGLLLLGGSLARIGLPLNAVLSNYSANLHYWIRPGGQNDFGLANPIRFDLANFQIVLDPRLGRSAATHWHMGWPGSGSSLGYTLSTATPSVRRRWPPSLRHRHPDAGPGGDLRRSRRRFATHRDGPETQAHETDSLRLIPTVAASHSVRRHPRPLVSFAASGETLVVELSDRAIHVVDAVGLHRGPTLCASCFG